MCRGNESKWVTKNFGKFWLSCSSLVNNFSMIDRMTSSRSILELEQKHELLVLLFDELTLFS